MRVAQSSFRRGANELHVVDFVLRETAPGAKRIMLTDTPLDNIFLPFIWLRWPKQVRPCAVSVWNRATCGQAYPLKRREPQQLILIKLKIKD